MFSLIPLFSQQEVAMNDKSFWVRADCTRNRMLKVELPGRRKRERAKRRFMPSWMCGWWTERWWP